MESEDEKLPPIELVRVINAKMRGPDVWCTLTTRQRMYVNVVAVVIGREYRLMDRVAGFVLGAATAFLALWITS